MRKLLALLLAVCALVAPRARAEAALTVNGSEITKAECVIYMLSARSKYAQIANYYEELLGIDYWSLKYANGMTAADMVKADVFKELLMMNVFYQLANDLSLALSDEDREICASDAREYYSSAPVSKAEAFTAADVAKLFEKQLLAGRMYGLLLARTDIDEQAVRDGVPADDYVTYDVEYLFRQRLEYDSAAGALSEEALMAALSEAAGAQSFEDAANALKDMDVRYGETRLVHCDADIDPVLKRAASQLAIGETTGVIETDFGWFVMRLIDNTNTDAYEQAVESALHAARESAFSSEYDELYAQAEYEINADFWDTLAPDAP